jgi:D-alanine-D-alanine ligase
MTGKGINQHFSKNPNKLAALQHAAAAVSARVSTVALLYGGTSGEREVSIASGSSVREALEAEGFTVAFIDTREPDFIDRLRAAKPDVAFIALHGKGGEDGCIQGFLETLGIPYTHSGVEASALAMDKRISKILYEIHGLATAGFTVVHKGSLDSNFLTSTNASTNARTASTNASTTAPLSTPRPLPCVVKPVCDGSSLGVAIPRTHEQFLQALDEGFEVGDALLIEDFIEGVEVTVPVLGNKVGDLVALPVIEIVPKNDFYDYESKYAEGGSVHIIPARITEAATAACQQAAVEAHAALGCTGVSRTDIIIAADNTPYLIETNTIPGMTQTSLIPEAAKAAGLSPGELYRLLIHYALEAHHAFDARES